MDKFRSEAYQTSVRELYPEPSYIDIIDGICTMRWSTLTENEIFRVARSYHFFSIQFRESLEIACRLYPNDANLKNLRLEECDTANLSPWPGVAEPGEKLDHDAFMDRLIRLQGIDEIDDLDAAGEGYLATVRAVGDLARAKAVASYEDTGLSRVFSAILQAPRWETPALRAFQHFLLKHIEFDTDSDGGHGLLARTLLPDETITPLWTAFEGILNRAVPRIATYGSRAD